MWLELLFEIALRSGVEKWRGKGIYKLYNVVKCCSERNRFEDDSKRLLWLESSDSTACVGAFTISRLWGVLDVGINIGGIISSDALRLILYSNNSLQANTIRDSYIESITRYAWCELATLNYYSNTVSPPKKEKIRIYTNQEINKKKVFVPAK